MSGERWIVCDGCFNLRDVGGYETTDGRRIRWRTLLRSDDLSGLTPGGLATFKALGVRSIVDVRGMEEVAAAAHPFGPSGAGVDGVGYWHWPLRDPADSALERAVQDAPSMVETYRLYLKHCAPRIAAIVKAFANAPEGGVLIHCQVGKDRTGVTVALLLSLCDVPTETIVEDYALSEGYLRPLYEARRAAGRVGAWDAWRSEPSTMRALLAHVEEEYGGARQYLLDGGLTPEEIERVRARLLE